MNCQSNIYSSCEILEECLEFNRFVCNLCIGTKAIEDVSIGSTLQSFSSFYIYFLYNIFWTNSAQPETVLCLRSHCKLGIKQKMSAFQNEFTNDFQRNTAEIILNDTLSTGITPQVELQKASTERRILSRYAIPLSSFHQSTLLCLTADSIPFRFEFPGDAPVSMVMQRTTPDSGDTCGVRYYIRCYSCLDIDEQQTTISLLNFPIKKVISQFTSVPTGFRVLKPFISISGIN